MTDARDGTMTSVTGPLPPMQAKVYAIVPKNWALVPRTGVPSAIIRALVERKLVRTRQNGLHWRREPTGGEGEVSLVCFRGADGRRWAELRDDRETPGDQPGRPLVRSSSPTKRETHLTTKTTADDTLYRSRHDEA